VSADLALSPFSGPPEVRVFREDFPGWERSGSDEGIDRQKYD
tara:strand:- start:627 stop:752 length:126 start_codon:yes stop_codon:yes gene_type:complete